MGSKTKRASSGLPNGPDVLQITQEKDKSRERLLAEVGFSPCGASANTARAFATGFAGELHLTAAIAVLQSKAAKVKDGDLSDLEATLIAQAVALDAIFNGLAKRAAMNMGQYMGACETYLRLALKAQAQCRSTLETLAEIKCPAAATFVRQQNVAFQQQVNNGAVAGESRSITHAGARGEKGNRSNELLSEAKGETLDTAGAGATGVVDSRVETMAEVVRAKD